jgi:DNA-binding CsgD family transcriptional regulator
MKDSLGLPPLEVNPVEDARATSLVDHLLNKLGLRRVERRRYMLDGHLVKYVEAVAENEQRLPEDVAAELLASGAAQRDLAFDTYHRWQTLSQREQEVAALVCLGYSYREIAIRLVISPETVKSHMKRVLYKFALHSKDELRMLTAEWDFSAWR